MDMDPALVVDALGELSLLEFKPRSTTGRSGSGCCSKTGRLAPSTTSSGIRGSTPYPVATPKPTRSSFSTANSSPTVRPLALVRTATFPAGHLMHHAPAEGHGCLCVTIFQRPLRRPRGHGRLSPGHDAHSDLTSANSASAPVLGAPPHRTSVEWRTGWPRNPERAVRNRSLPPATQPTATAWYRRTLVTGTPRIAARRAEQQHGATR
jgi:hypothetical protein